MDAFIEVKTPPAEFRKIHREILYVRFNNVEEMGDGYHTMKELYEHRYALFYALTKVYDSFTPLGSYVTCWKSKLHDDGTMFEDSFIVGMTLKQFEGINKYITYHLPLSWWDKFNLVEYPRAPQYDGHTSRDVIAELMRL